MEPTIQSIYETGTATGRDGAVMDLASLEKGEGWLGFIFIDGWHTFDHMLLDCFYATRLLRVWAAIL